MDYTETCVPLWDLPAGLGDFFWPRLGNLVAAANVHWCTRLSARQLILGSEWTCYNRVFDLDELLSICTFFEQ